VLHVAARLQVRAARSVQLEGGTAMSAEVDQACRAQTALMLAEAHGIPVFPCKPDKQPYTAHGFKDASTDVKRIDQWFSERPDALIAVPTGNRSKLFVVDIDPAAAEWYREHAERLECGRVHNTRRGHHLVYRMPSIELRNTAGQLAPGVDTRGEGGYIIWWPAHGFEATGALEDLTEPPAWIVEALRKPSQQRARANGNGAHESVTEGGRNDYLSREAFRLRKHGSTPEQIYIVLRAMNEAHCKPPLPDAELSQIAGGKAGVATDADDDPWPTNPANLLGEFIPAPLTAADVPQEIGAYACLYSAKTGIDRTLTLAMAVGACAAAITDEIQLCADSSTNWFQQARLWMLCLAPPGEGKTPAFKEALRPLRELHHELTETWKRECKAWEADCKKAAEADDEKPPKPPQPRVVIDDATLEKLSDVLVENPRGVLVATDEFSTWIGSLDQYRSNGGMDRDRGEWLRLFDGGPHSIERVKRGSVYVPNWGASIITTTTPAALKKLSKHLPEDGLIQRFLTFIVGDRAVGDDSIGGIDAARDRYVATVRRLFALRARSHKGVVPLSLAARECFRAWNADITRLLRASRDSSPALAGHIAKYPTFALRLALTFHCARLVSDERLIDPAAYPVPVETLEMALRFLRRAQQHAFALYLNRFGSETFTLAQDIARFVLARAEKNDAGLQRRDLLRQVQSFRNADDWKQTAALRWHYDYGWLRIDDGGYTKAGPTRFKVNPNLAARFADLAEKTRQDRAAMRAAIEESAAERRASREQV
jgi:hypothetical protein